MASSPPTFDRPSGSPPNQLGLLKRRTDLTHEQFIDYWLRQHAPRGIPWALAIGVESYIQIHRPRLSAAGRAALGKEEGVRIEDFDGAASMTFFPSPPETKGDDVQAAKISSFFEKVVVPDEKNFLPGAARDVVVFVDDWMVEGERVHLIKDGKVTDAVQMGDAWKRWEEWSA